MNPQFSYGQMPPAMPGSASGGPQKAAPQMPPDMRNGPLTNGVPQAPFPPPQHPGGGAVMMGAGGIQAPSMQQWPQMQQGGMGAPGMAPPPMAAPSPVMASNIGYPDTASHQPPPLQQQNRFEPGHMPNAVSPSAGEAFGKAFGQMPPMPGATAGAPRMSMQPDMRNGPVANGVAHAHFPAAAAYPGAAPSGMGATGMHPPGMPSQMQSTGMPPSSQPHMYPSQGMDSSRMSPAVSAPGMPPNAGSPAMAPPMGAPGMPSMGFPGMAPPPSMGAPGMAMGQQSMGAPGMGPPMGQQAMGGAPGMGPPQQQAQRRLDPSQMPSAVSVIEDNRISNTGRFPTGYPHAEAPPLVTTDFYCEDQGNCRPSFVRSTMYGAPASGDLLKSIGVPFGLSISPMALKHEKEYELPVVVSGPDGPVRCVRCKAYMCPFMQFRDGGRRFYCPLCKAGTDVDEQYFCHLDQMGRRTDLCERPEMMYGSYEFTASTKYCRNGVFPKEPAFIFMLDVSYNAVNSGLLALFCRHIRQLLDFLPKEAGVEKSVMRFGIATYDRTVQFYNLKSSLGQAQMMVVGDVEDVFEPMADGFLVTLDEAADALDSLLLALPDIFRESRVTEMLLGPAVQAGMQALKAADRTGKLLVFHSSLPLMEAPGKLKNRDDQKLLGTDKEKTILTPQTDFYENLAVECVGVGCCVDVFLFPNGYVDVATIGSLCAKTGGELYKYQYFDADRDGQRLLYDLQHDIERPIIFDTMVRVRTSTGIRPTGFWGNFHMANTTDIEVAAIDSDKAINVELRHDDKLTDQLAFVQVAVLFTSVGGQRRLRVHNLALQVTSSYHDLFRLVDLDTVINFLAKQAETMLIEKQPKDVREWLVTRCAQALACYRERCSEQTPAGQLLLPEAMKLMPLYVNCLIRHDAISGAADVGTDNRAWQMLRVRSMRVLDSVSLLYPRVLPVSALPSPDADDWAPPPAERASFEQLDKEEAYLIENGFALFLWVGLRCSPAWVQDVFGVNAVMMIDTEKMHLPEKDTAASRSLRRLIEHLHYNRSLRMKLYIIREQDKLQPWMQKYLVEDRGAANLPSYVDFLCKIHSEIRSILH